MSNLNHHVGPVLLWVAVVSGWPLAFVWSGNSGLPREAPKPEVRETVFRFPNSAPQSEAASAPSGKGLNRPDNKGVETGTDHSFFLLSGQDEDFTPVLRDQFPALMDNHSAIPPDTHGAVGPEHLMVALNTEVAIQNRQGELLTKTSLAQFWAGLNHDHVVDPKVLYDHLARRWFLTTVADPHTTNSAVLIAVSQTQDPTGGWHQCSIPVDPEGNLWADYPNIGYNQNWVVATYNVFSTETNAFVHSEIFAFRKPDFCQGATAEYARFSDPGFFTVAPATTYDADEPDLYLVTENGSQRLRITKLTGPVGDESYETNGVLTPKVPAWTFAPTNGNFSPQQGSSVKIHANDSRMQSVAVRNGSIWCTHHIFLPATNQTVLNPERSAVQWWQLRPNGAIEQRGRIDDADGPFHYTFPSIAVNRFEDVLIGYSRFASDQFAGAYYSYRLADDPPGTMRGDFTLKPGEAAYVRQKADGRNSWGDFSATVVDPLNGVDMWTIQEYAASPDALEDRWGTWWGYVGFQAESPPVLTRHPAGQSIALVGTNVLLDVEVDGTGPMTYQWRFNGEPLPAETDAALELENIQPADAGNYSVAITNVAGYTISEPALVDFIPLAFTQQPSGGSVKEDGDWQLSVGVDGTRPYQFQWYHNDAPIPGATESELHLTEFKVEDAGDYFVSVGNPLETITSQSVTLTFAPKVPVEFDEVDFNRNTSRLRFVIEGEPGVSVVLQYSLNLRNWIDIQTVELSDQGIILQINAGSFEHIFLRARLESEASEEQQDLN